MLRRFSRPAGPLVLAAAAPLVLAGVPAVAATARPAATPAAGTATAAAAACRWQSRQPPDPAAGTDDLFGVAVRSATSAWAVGNYSRVGGPFRTLVERWNGSAWRRVASPAPGAGDEYLDSVQVVAPRSVWAAGAYAAEAGGVVPDKTLILHWNGSGWRRLPTPSPSGGIDNLNGLRMVSATSGWAVGEYTNPAGHSQSLILHWNGTSWKRAASPDPGTISNTLSGVTSVSRSSAWAVGSFGNGGATRSLVLHWNGTSWKRVASPDPNGGSELDGVSATSAANAWAVGDDRLGRSLILHWNGRGWTRVPSPNVLGQGDDNLLQAVAATSASNAWAVGQATILTFGTAFELHWNGRTWANMASPVPGSNSAMDAVAATSASDAWAVGEFSRDSQGVVHRTLAFRCR
jgi:hypothetical protein